MKTYLLFFMLTSEPNILLSSNRVPVFFFMTKLSSKSSEQFQGRNI